jgi:hypothetical protein
VGGDHNWNERAIEQMVRDLAAPWRELRSMLLSSLERDTKFIRDLMDSSMDYAGNKDEFFFLSLADRFTENQLQHSSELAETLGQTMRSRQHLLLAEIEKAIDGFEDGLE